MSSRRRTVDSHPKLYLKMRMMKISTKMGKVLNLLKVKHVWNQIQAQLKMHKKIHCICQNLLTRRFLLDEYKIFL